MRKEIGAILLCGGRSARMGQDKGLVEWDGQPLVVRAARLLRGLSVEVLAVTGYSRRYVELLEPLGVTVLADRVPGLGPLGGIHTGLLHSKREYNLVLACDMPLVEPALLELLIDEISPEFAVIVPQVRGFFEPLLAIYSRRCLPAIEGLLAAGKRKPIDLYGLAPIKVVPEEKLRRIDPELKSFFNLNVPERMQQLLTQQASGDTE